jgi:hypothetical protein
MGRRLKGGQKEGMILQKEWRDGRFLSTGSRYDTASIEKSES